MKLTLAETLEEYKSIKIQNESLLKKKRKYNEQIKKIKEEIRKHVFTPENIVPFLVPGRIIRIKYEDNDFGWGIVVNFNK